MRASRLNSCFSDALVAVAVVVALEDEHLAKRKIIVGPCLSLLSSVDFI